MEETETEHLISEQKKMLDNLLDEYELTLNTRLDDLDALVSDMITQVNLSAVEINSTLQNATENVGYTLSNEMDNIWSKAAEQMAAGNSERVVQTQRLIDQLVAQGVLSREDANNIISALGEGDAQGITNATNIITKLESEGVLSAAQAEQLREVVQSTGSSYNGVVTTYGDDFSSKLTTTNSTLAGITAYVKSLADKAAQEAAEAAAKLAEEEAAKKQAEAEATAKASQSSSTKTTAQAATTTTAKTTVTTVKTTTTTKKTTTTTKKTTTTTKKTTTTTKKKTLDNSTKMHVAAAIWNGNYGWSVDPTRATRLKEVFGSGNGIQSIVNKGYSYSSGYSPKGYSYTEMRKKFKGYASGLKKAKYDEDAWVNEQGLETILSPSNRAIITHISKGDSVLDAEATKNLFDMANNPDDYINGGSWNGVVGESLGGQVINMGDNEISISLPNVKNYDEFKAAMQKDKELEKFWCAITVDPLLGKNKSRKNRFNF